MTVRDALISTINFPLPENTIAKALIDAGLNGDAIYTRESAKAVGVCMAGLLFTLITTADQTEDDVSIRLPQRDVLMKVYSGICSTYGVPDAFSAVKPTVKQVRLW